MTIATLVSALAALVVFPFAAYLGLLALLAWAPKPIAPRARTSRFKVVVPAHDEELSIKATVESLLSLDWPKDLYDVVVVADNCGDRTAEIARQAGATVL
jgi:cellulose synthase/poly-beta-1,6-N-acetylglucosamine synthase-like glycosyltransferase